MPEILDDKSQYCIPFILERLKIHQRNHLGKDNSRPFVLALNGVQGAGKTTLVTTLSETLRSPPHSLSVVVLSIDDLYLTHAAQKQLAESHASNPLIQHRGQPSTHDISLGISLFASLLAGKPTKIPQYDKSRFNGQGDRVDESEWQIVNKNEGEQIQVVVFEGWCVGFRALGKEGVQKKWDAARIELAHANYNGRLAYNKFEDLIFVDEALRQYDTLTDQFDALIHIDAEDTHFVYEWRWEQEAALRSKGRGGMSNEQVKTFVDGYYPAYELYTDNLRAGIFGSDSGKQLRLIVDEERKVKDAIRL
ncbi:hypothetical protein MMC13_008491 [Lambiella insularis]|nr:hypothetical protein [Lambiella insularis]